MALIEYNGITLEQFINNSTKEEILSALYAHFSTMDLGFFLKKGLEKNKNFK